MTVVLASASSARRALLEAAGVPFDVRPAGIDERAVEVPLIAGGASPADLASALADEKALAVSREDGNAVVIGADQTLDVDGNRWTKPANLAEAREQLARLSGREHRLHSAVAIARGGTLHWRHREEARLTLRPLTAAEIDAYLGEAGEAVLASVGAYQIEGPAIRLFERIEGDYFAILGLPLLPLLRYLRSEGEIAW